MISKSLCFTMKNKKTETEDKLSAQGHSKSI
jgi:hypothetical protein